jgi:transposase
MTVSRQARQLREAKLCIGRLACALGVTNTAKLLGYSYQRVHYWYAIVQNRVTKEFPGHGPKYQVLSQARLEAVMTTIRNYATNNQGCTIADFIQEVNRVNHITLSQTTIWRILGRLNLTHTRVSIIQQHKFTELNAFRYVHYTQMISTINREVIYYLDEASFNPRFLFAHRAWGPRGRTVALINRRPLGEKGCTTTIITSIRDGLTHPIFHQIRQGTNTRWDFIAFVTAAIEAGFLRRHSIVVLDNARVHTAAEVGPYLERIADTLNIRFVFLPAYSPELNAAELCFASCKRYFRKNRNQTENRNELISVGFNRIDVEEMRNYYAHCIECRFAGKSVIPRLL